MAKPGTVGETGFDFQTAKRQAMHYTNATGVCTNVIDQRGMTMEDGCSEYQGCRFCKHAHQILGDSLICREAHLYGSYQAERFGGRYIFFCPMGLTHWVSPIYSNGYKQGALVAGPVLMVEPDDFLLDDFFRKNNISDQKIKLLENSLKEIPVIRPDRVDSMSEILMLVAKSLSDDQESFNENNASMQHQSDISEYIYYLKQNSTEEAVAKSYPLEKEKELLSLIAMGDKAGAQRVLNEIFGFIFFSTGRNFEIIKARILELIVLLSRAALEGGADIEQIFGLNYRFLSDIHTYKTIEDMTWWLSKIMGRFTDCVFNLANVKHADVIYKAVDFIRRNYMKKLSLEEVASHVYLSPSYFSKIFKEEMGCNFVVYLNQIRIAVSKKLLMDDTIDLVDVSNLVGYDDQSYFSKIFKKCTGITPGKFRESRGQIKSFMTDEVQSENRA